MKGYVVIREFLKRDEVQELADLYFNYPSGADTGFHVTNWMKKFVHCEKIHNGVVSVLSEKVQDVLNQYKPVLGCFAVKKPDYDNKMGLHQDWSIVDENYFDGISLWIPLIDVDDNSGALRILEGSHQLFSNVRGQKIHNQLDDLSVSNIYAHLTSLPMKAGDMLVLHHRLVHCSEASTSNKERVVAMLAMIPQEAVVRHYMAQKDYDVTRNIRVFNCADDFYINFDIESEPMEAVEVAGVQQTEYLMTDQMIADSYQM